MVGDNEDTAYQPVLTHDMAARQAFTSLVSLGGQTAIVCGQDASIFPDDAEVVYTESKTWVVTLGNCAFVIDDDTGRVIGR